MYHSGTRLEGGSSSGGAGGAGGVGGLSTSGGRVLAVTGVGPSLGAALRAAYGRLDGGGVAFEGLHRRSDIG